MLNAYRIFAVFLTAALLPFAARPEVADLLKNLTSGSQTKGGAEKMNLENMFQAVKGKDNGQDEQGLSLGSFDIKKVFQDMLSHGSGDPDTEKAACDKAKDAKWKALSKKCECDDGTKKWGGAGCFRTADAQDFLKNVERLTDTFHTHVSTLPK
jgi:hypothetical protein